MDFIKKYYSHQIGLAQAPLMDFEELALAAFRYQVKHCAVYADFVHQLGANPDKIELIHDIPYLPVSFFKSQKVISENAKEEAIFTSSGTGASGTSRHYVQDLSLYESSFREAFQLFYGDIHDYCVIALLPSYTESGNSSLIYMVKDLIASSDHDLSGFYHESEKNLSAILNILNDREQKTFLFGVTYALLDFAERRKEAFTNLTVLETGGMKGRRKEILREELHNILCGSFGVSFIHSEYGMTELLSQAYSSGNGIFRCPPWMRVSVRDVNDPLSKSPRQRGGINIIDLANINSCCFIETQDLGKVNSDGSFEVLGRFDNSDLRGCSLLI